MNTSILPIDIDKLKDPEPVAVAVPPLAPLETVETPEELPSITMEITDKKELFEKPVIEIDIPPPKIKKKRKPLSPEHLAKLAAAREISLARRKELKGAKALEAATKRLERKNKIESKIAKKMEEDAVMEMKAQIYKDANTDSTFNEERLMSLMERTIDNYIDKKKKSKPLPTSFIPAQNAYPQYAPQQVDPKYYQPVQQQQQSGYQQQRPSGYNNGSSGNAVSNLFGFN